MLVIHPYDTTTLFLTELYNDIPNIDIINSNTTPNSIIKEKLKSHNTIILLGHGTEDGLLCGHDIENNIFNRFIIDCSHVQLLRNKNIIGIWCNANIFAEKYGLNGLFSGMIISELTEAYDCGVLTTTTELELENVKLAKNLRYCLDNYNLVDIPTEFAKLNNSNSQLTDFNYNSIYFNYGS